MPGNDLIVGRSRAGVIAGVSLNKGHACFTRRFRQSVIERRYRQIVTDHQFEIRGVVGGKFILADQRPDGREHPRPGRIFDFDGEIGQTIQKCAGLLSVMRPLRTASPVTLTTSYNHKAGTIALSVRLARRLSKVSVSGVASSPKHHAIVTVLSRTNRLKDGLRQLTPLLSVPRA